MKSSAMKRVLSLALAFVLTLASIPAVGLHVWAETSWPWLSAAGYCEYVSVRNVDVYMDADLSTRGASGKSYNAYVEAGDHVKIYKITNSYSYLSYPTASGNKKGYVETSKLLGVSAPVEYVTSSGKAVTYSSVSDSSSSGYVARNDDVYRLGTVRGGEYILVMYPAVSGSRSYKAALVKASDYSNIILGSSRSYESNAGSSDSSSGNTEEEVLWRIYQISSGKLKYDDNTVLKLGKTFVGTRASEQCKGYAKNVFYLCFGITPGSTQSKPNNYRINDTSGMTCVGSLSELSADSVRNLFANSKSGDFVQMRRSHGGSHSAIVYKASSENVIFLEANTDGRNTIVKKEYTWSELCEKNSAMSVYTATDYRLK